MEFRADTRKGHISITALRNFRGAFPPANVDLRARARQWFIVIHHSKSVNENRPHPLTGSGKILLAATLLLFGALWYVSFIGVFQRLPPGTNPRFVLLAPSGIAAALFFFGLAWFLRTRGVATFTSEIDEVRADYARKTGRDPNAK